MVDARIMRRTVSAVQLCRRAAPVLRPNWVRTGVALPRPPDRSRATLDFVPAIARPIPIVATLFAQAMTTYRRVHGRDFDFNSAYWRPPLSPAEVVASERDQIERRFGFNALVSLTDHDTV